MMFGAYVCIPGCRSGTYLQAENAQVEAGRGHSLWILEIELPLELHECPGRTLHAAAANGHEHDAATPDA